MSRGILSLASGSQIAAQIGAELLGKLEERNPGRGGRLVMITGEQGAGKTSLMGKFALEFIGEEYVIWRGRFLAQWHKFPNWEKKVQILVHEDDEVEFLKIPYQGDAEKVDIPVVRYRDARDVIQKLRKDKINVIYEPASYRISPELARDVKERTGKVIPSDKLEEDRPVYFWFELLYCLLTRDDRDWYAVFIDEADDVFPEIVPGVQYALQDWVKDILKDLRKALVSLILSTHTISNLDWRIRTKIPAYIYLRGAQVRKGSKIKPGYIAMLDDGYAYIEWGKYGIFRFSYLPWPGYDIQVRRRRSQRGRG